jgi:hypothetical protein
MLDSIKTLPRIRLQPLYIEHSSLPEAAALVEIDAHNGGGLSGVPVNNGAVSITLRP